MLAQMFGSLELDLEINFAEEITVILQKDISLSKLLILWSIYPINHLFIFTLIN